MLSQIFRIWIPFESEARKMKKLSRAIALFFVIALVLASVPAFERDASADTSTVWVASVKCPVYKQKDTSSKLLGTLYFGESMICENYSSKKTGWARVMNSKGKGRGLMNMMKGFKG